jgi:hypothetical protein
MRCVQQNAFIRGWPANASDNACLPQMESERVASLVARGYTSVAWIVNKYIGKPQ